PQACLSTSLPTNVSWDATAGRRRYYDGGSNETSCTTSLCDYPWSDVTGGEHDTVCGTAVDATHDSSGCSSLGGSLKTYYTGSVCTRIGTCKPNASTQSQCDSCGGITTYFNGTDCTSNNCPTNYKTVTSCSSTTGGCTAAAGVSGGTTTVGRAYYTSANSCTVNNAACTLSSTYSDQCGTTCTATPNTYHNATSCGTITCPNNYPADNSASAPACRTAAFNYYTGSSCTANTTTYPTNCTTFCTSDKVGCYVNSTVLYSGMAEGYRTLNFYFQDSWKNMNTNAIYTSNSSTWQAGIHVETVDQYDSECQNHRAVGCNLNDLYNTITTNLNIGGISRTRPTNYYYSNWSSQKWTRGTVDNCVGSIEVDGLQYCNYDTVTIYP
ncbi:hypothetical protein HYW41_00005, partial [Candidatus Daviesbacteria bacterium]|nr:hypothetical protein [Candidatus Daviesbacteria bacterium]